MGKYKKDTIIQRLIVRIQSLFPDDCGLCKQSYSVHYKSKPLLSCAKCSQGIHTRCLASNLGVAEIDLEAMSADDIQAAINPTGISTLVYLCGYCHKSEIASDDQGLRQTKKPKQVSDLADSHNLINLDSDNGTGPRSKNPPRPSGKATNHPNNNKKSSDADSESEEEPPAAPRQRRLTKTKGHDPSKHQGTIPSDAKARLICAYYRRGQCRYGMSGKGCSRAHPSLCRKLMNNGNKHPQGCSKGKSCDKFHPKMCPSSIDHRECLNDECRMWHVKGTRRNNSRQPHLFPKHGTATEEHP